MITQNYIYNATITKIVDGDTVDARVDLGFTVSVDVRFRLYGIDTMEINDRDLAKRSLALRARERLTELISNQKVTLRSHKTDKYGRWLAEIYINNVSVNATLLSEGLAVEYLNNGKLES